MAVLAAKCLPASAGTLDPWLQASPEADAEPPTPSPEAPPPTGEAQQRLHDFTPDGIAFEF